jgi:hypothetical protein
MRGAPAQIQRLASWSARDRRTFSPPRRGRISAPNQPRRSAGEVLRSARRTLEKGELTAAPLRKSPTLLWDSVRMLLSGSTTRARDRNPLSVPNERPRNGALRGLCTSRICGQEPTRQAGTEAGAPGTSSCRSSGAGAGAAAVGAAAPGTVSSPLKVGDQGSRMVVGCQGNRPGQCFSLCWFLGSSLFTSQGVHNLFPCNLAHCVTMGRVSRP